MARTLQFRRGNTSVASAFTGAVGEIFVNTDTDTIHVQDGTTAGGHALAKASDVTTLTSNAAVQSGDIATIYANLGVVSGSLATLTANAGAQAGSIATLEANAATQAGAIAALEANAAVQAGLIASTSSNTITNGTSTVAVTTANGNVTVTTVGTNTWTFDTTGTLTVPGIITSASDTSIRAEDDVFISGGDKTPASASGEGGDIDLTGGWGRIDNGITAGSGGDVSLYGGDGGDAVNADAGVGGFVQSQGGLGGTANVINGIQAGTGGYVQLQGGNAGDNQGDNTLSAPGGDVNIYGGNGSMDNANAVPDGSPGHINIYGGNWGYVVPSGNIYLNTYDGVNLNTLTYNNTGNIIMPSNGRIQFAGSNSGIRFNDTTLQTTAYTGQVNGYDIGYRNVPQISAGNVTLALSDSGKHYYADAAYVTTLTIPSNANVAFTVGSAITIVNAGTGNVSIDKQVEANLYLAGNGTSSTRTLTSYGMATLLKTSTDQWFISGTGLV